MKEGGLISQEELAVRIQAGQTGPEAIEALYLQMRGYIVAIARRYQQYGELEDLLQEGFLGLYAAVEHYDREKGNFGSYAGFWIRRALTRYLEDCGNVVRIPSSERQRQREYQRFVSAFEQEHGRRPGDGEICRALGLREDSLSDLRRRAGMGQIGSLDAAAGEEEGVTLGDLVPDSRDAYGELLEEAQEKELRAVLWPLVDSLPGNQPEILRGRYQEGKTLRQLGEELGRPISSVRNTESNALRELAKPSRARRLRPFWRDEEIRSRGMKGTGAERFRQTWTSATEREALRGEA